MPYNRNKSATSLVQGSCGTGCLIAGSLGCRLRKVKYIGQFFIMSSISLLISGQNRLDGHFFFRIFKSEMSLMDSRLHFSAEGGRHYDYLVLQKNHFMVRNFTAVGVIRKWLFRYLMFFWPTIKSITNKGL